MGHHNEFVQDLRRAGHRVTSPRERILSVIRASDGHITAEEILRRVRARFGRADKSSLYRTLDLLTRLNLLNPTDFGNGRIEYEIHQHPHHHLRCHKCGKIERVDGTLLDSVGKRLRAEFGFAADLDHFAIFGLCRKCQKPDE